MQGKLSLVPVLCALAILASCSGGGSMPMSNATKGTPSSQVSLTMGDTPPAGVAVLSFEITVQSAALQPGSVALVSRPMEIELTKLQTAHTLLGSLSVPAGTYSGVALTFGNAQLTIVNNSGSAIGSCGIGQTCELHPALSQTNVSFTGAPFPLTLAADSPLGLLVDFNIQQSIQNDLSINPVITVSRLAKRPGGDMDDLDDIVGQVTAVDASKQQFTLQVGGVQGHSQVIQVNSSTRFEDFAEQGMASGFASIAVGQVLHVDALLMSDGTVVAKEVGLMEHDRIGALDGVVVSVDSATQFKMAVLDDESDDGGSMPGKVATVTVQSGATFSVDTDGIAIPSGLTFGGAADLMVGQGVAVHPVTVSMGAVTTDRVRLRFSRVSGRVAAISGSNFTLDNLPSLFTTASPAITTLDVRTSAQTIFIFDDQIGSLSGLAAGNNVRVAGWLFKTSGTPALVAVKVRRSDN